jgi:anaerobic ribonucleoside-triphosphate reductase
MVEMCAICKNELLEKQGLISSTKVLVCSEECRDKFVDSLPGKGESLLTIYSRVTGYITPVNSWNKGKRQEFLDRRHYSTIGALP